MSNLTKRAWKTNTWPRTPKCTSIKRAFSGTLLYGSETWTTYIRQESGLNTFHLRCLRRIRGVKWQDHITNSDILSCACIPSMQPLFSQRRLRLLRHVHRMDDGHIPKEVLYGQLTTGVRKVGRGRLQTWPQSMRNWFKQLWCCVWSWPVEADSERRNSEGRGEMSTESWWEACLPQKQLYFAFLLLLMRLVQQGLPLTHWPAQPHKKMQHHYELIRAHKLCLSRLRLPIIYEMRK